MEIRFGLMPKIYFFGNGAVASHWNDFTEKGSIYQYEDESIK